MKENKVNSGIQFIQTSPQELMEQINLGIQRQLDTFLKEFKPKQSDEYLTREEVARLFKVNISTIHNWCKSGKLKPLGIGNRVYFKQCDIEQSLIPING